MLLLAKVGFDTAENEPTNNSPKNIRDLLLHVSCDSSSETTACCAGVRRRVGSRLAASLLAAEELDETRASVQYLSVVLLSLHKAFGAYSAYAAYLAYTAYAQKIVFN